MKNNLQVINEREVLGRQFRIYGDFENPLFLAKDVAEWIEHNKPSEMLMVIDEDEKLKSIISHSGQNREMWFLTEDGLYEVLMQSRKPTAKQFKKEVKKILKSIRKHGAYMTPEKLAEMIAKPENAIKLFQALADEQEKTRKLEIDNKILVEDNKALAGEILEWKDKAKLNKAVRVFAGIADIHFGKAWTMLYDELLYKHSIGVRQRSGKPYINNIKEKEWPLVIQSMSALCEKEGVSPSEIFNKAKLGSGVA